MQGYQIMGAMGYTFGVFTADGPRQALDKFAREVAIRHGTAPAPDFGWADHCKLTGLPDSYRVDGFRVFVS